jgi:hypothetical protein
MNVDREKENLLERCDRERLQCEAEQFRLAIELDLAAALAIIGNLQLALTHPGNKGLSAQTVREVIAGMIRRMREAGLAAHADLARLGDDPAYDDSREENGGGAQ